MAVSAAPEDTRPTAPARPSRWFRGDVDGLRALAIILVVGYHVGLPGFGGGFIGVDVFFVISGFLISRNLLREAQGRERVGLASFWARRIRRLVPALALVIVFTLVVGHFVFPLFELGQFARQGAAAALYVSNIKFAGQAQSYFGGDVSSSPFLHTWSLGVEEQFYLLWPVLFALVCWTAREPLSARIPDFRRKALVGVFAVTFLASFATNVALTNHGSTWAFYGLQSRAWEFAAAGLLAAITVPNWLRGVPARTALAVAGLVILAVGLVTIRGSTPYPGLWALLPVLATVALITAGHTWEGQVDPNPISSAMSTSSAQWLGRVSYSWYLWHWPAIILVATAFDTTNTALAATAAAWALGVSWLTYRYYETPIRFEPRLANSNTRTFAFGAVVTVLVLLVTYLVTPSTPGLAPAQALGVGPATMAQLQAPPGSSLQQQVNFEVSLFRHRLTLECPSTGATSTPDGDLYCPDGDAISSNVLLVLGDSHAGQWRRVLSQIASSEHLRLVLRERDGCPPFRVDTRAPYMPVSKMVVCQRQEAGDLRVIDQIKPQALIIIPWNGYLPDIRGAPGQTLTTTQKSRLWEQQAVTMFRFIQSRGIKLGFVYDEPTLAFDASKCIASANKVAPCVPTRSAALAQDAPLLAAEKQAVAQVGHISTLDLTDVICGPRTCPLQVGGTLVYIDAHHLTDAFALTQLGLMRSFVNRVERS